MEAITLQEILTATGGALLGSFRDLSATVTAVDTDSRAMCPGSLFVPLLGEKFDGHAYISSALASAAGTLTQQTFETYDPDRFYVLVEDTTRALGDLAHYYRHKFDLKVVAVTGSVGKTTCKDMIASVLSTRFRVLKTDGNFNNIIGVPKTLFRLDSSHQAAVIEMGMDHLGEIDRLTKIVNPDIAVITNIGDAHIENLGCRENTLKAKSEIFHGMTGRGLAILNGDDPLLRTLSGKLEQQILWYGRAEDCDFRCNALDESYDDHMVMELTATLGQWRQVIVGLGSHMIYPVLAAVAVGSWFEMSIEEIRRGVMSFVPTKMRMNRISLPGDIILLNDTYNANPQSMRAGAEVLSKTPGTYKIAVLGDMLELGALGPTLHEDVGRCVAQFGIDCLVAVGDLAESIYRGAVEAGIAEAYHRPNKDEAKVVLEHILRPGCTVLCKASRGMRLEELAEFIMDLSAVRWGKE